MNRFIYRDDKLRRAKEKSTPLKGLFSNFFTKVLLLSVSLFLLYNIGHSIYITIQKLDILRSAKMEVDELRLNNLQLALLLENMESKEYLEVQARNRLNFAGEKEYIFVIPENILEEAGKNIEGILQINQEEDIKVYEEWQRFLLEGI
jgi:cell division protein FtsB